MEEGGESKMAIEDSELTFPMDTLNLHLPIEHSSWMKLRAE